MSALRPAPSLCIRALALLLLLTSCAQEQSLQRGTPLGQEAIAAIDQLEAEAKVVCAREEYKPLFLHTACAAENITLEQLADKSMLAATDKPLFWKLHAENHVIATKLATALRLYGGAQGVDVALASERADRSIEKNALALYDGTTNWGDYNERWKEINEMLNDEFDSIVPQPRDSPEITLLASCSDL